LRDISYLTDHFDEKIKRIRELDAPLNFVFITDMHNRLNQYAVKNGHVDLTDYELGIDAVTSIRYILDRCPGIGCVICGGDIGCDYNPDLEEKRFAHEEIMGALHSLPVPVYSCIGNHDDLLGCAKDKGFDTKEHVFLPADLHRILLPNIPGENNYYYIDIGEEWRFVFLDTSDKPYFLDETGQYAFGWRLEVSDKQAIWLEKEALVTGRKIIVFSHSPLSNAGMIGSEGEPDLIKPYDDLRNAPRVLHAVRSCPNVAAMVAGHVHFDNIRYDDGILSMTTLCSFVQEWTSICPKREIGTVTETAFDVISVKDNMMYMTRFGAGEDRCGALLRLFR